MSATCRSCSAPIVWAITQEGRRMPLDAEPAREGNVLLYPDGTCRALRADEVIGGAIGEHLHRSHFATCPEAAEHRRRRS